MSQLQNRIGSLESKPKSKPHFRFARWLLSIVYVLALVISLALPFGFVAVTASYTMLMLLLWLHERYPPASVK